MEMATAKKPRATKTSAELKRELDEARKRVAALEQRAYAEELTELIRATNIVADFQKIQSKVTDIKPAAILAAIASTVGLKRVQVTQLPPTPRKPADPNKPKKPRAPKNK
jgi:hypothetical protein